MNSLPGQPIKTAWASSFNAWTNSLHYCLYWLCLCPRKSSGERSLPSLCLTIVFNSTYSQFSFWGSASLDESRHPGLSQNHLRLNHIVIVSAYWTFQLLRFWVTWLGRASASGPAQLAVAIRFFSRKWTFFQLFSLFSLSLWEFQLSNLQLLPPFYFKQ